MNRSSIVAVVDDKGREKERYPFVYGRGITIADGDPVRANQDLLEPAPNNPPAVTHSKTGSGAIPENAGRLSRPVRNRRCSPP